jgi:hypothetical protein
MLPLHHDPEMQAGWIRFHRACSIVMLLVSSGSPESRTQRHSVISRVRATGPRLPRRRIFSTQLTFGFRAHLPRSGSGGARIRVSWSSARRYTISATDPTKQQKKPDVLMTPGFRYSSNLRGPVSRAQWIIGAHIRRMTDELFSRYPSFCDT